MAPAAVVAGLPSERISQLSFPQLVRKHRRANVLGAANSALHDGMSEILNPALARRRGCSLIPFNRNSGYDKYDGDRCVGDDSAIRDGFAGKSTCSINKAVHGPGCKKGSGIANKSLQMTDLFCNEGNNIPPPLNRGTRSLRQQCDMDNLSDTFCTKFQITNPMSGRTEFMAARKAGKAAAEVFVTGFDPYVMPRERKESIWKAKDNIDHNVLGLMPKPHAAAKFSSGTIVRKIRVPTLECKDNWMVPTAAANVCKPLGKQKSHRVFPWTPAPSNYIAHVVDPESAEPSERPLGSVRPVLLEP